MVLRDTVYNVASLAGDVSVHAERDSGNPSNRRPADRAGLFAVGVLRVQRFGRTVGRVWDEGWDRIWAYLDSKPDAPTYDSHTLAAAGCGDRDDDTGTDDRAEAYRRPGTDLSIPGPERPGPYLLDPYTDANGDFCGFTLRNSPGVRGPDVRRVDPNQILPDGGG